MTYSKGEPEAWVRFKTENYGKDLHEKMAKVEKLMIKDTEVKTSLLEGEEETKFLEGAVTEMKTHRAKSKNHKRKGYGGRGGGGGGHAKRGRH